MYLGRHVLNKVHQACEYLTCDFELGIVFPVPYTTDSFHKPTLNLEAYCIIGYISETGIVRLIDGANFTSGRVEVMMNGRFGSVCSSGWTDDDARVVCRY